MFMSFWYCIYCSCCWWYIMKTHATLFKYYHLTSCYGVMRFNKRINVVDFEINSNLSDTRSFNWDDILNMRMLLRMIKSLELCRFVSLTIQKKIAKEGTPTPSELLPFLKINGLMRENRSLHSAEERCQF